MKLKLIQVGRTKDPGLEQTARELVKRLGRFCDLEIVELKDQSPSKTFSIERCIEEEAETILSSLKDEDFVLALDEKGREFSSEKFAETLEKLKDEGRKPVFIIGGAFGLSKKVKQRADMVLALSKMTFTHQMVRPIILEQLYRAFCIITGKEYHH